MKILRKSPAAPGVFMAIISDDVIAITFAPIRLFGIYVTVGLNTFNPGGVAVRIPGTDWWLDASSKNME